MLNFRESLVSAHHNYLVNQMLAPGFVVGDPDSKDNFYFVADVLRPQETEPRIYARLFDEKGAFVLEMEPERLVQNPSGCVRHLFPGGYRIAMPSGETLLHVQIESFANGFLTRVQGKLYDRNGNLLMEPHFDAVQVRGEIRLWLKEPLRTK